MGILVGKLLTSGSSRSLYSLPSICRAPCLHIPCVLEMPSPPIRRIGKSSYQRGGELEARTIVESAVAEIMNRNNKLRQGQGSC